MTEGNLVISRDAYIILDLVLKLNLEHQVES